MADLVLDSDSAAPTLWEVEQRLLEIWRGLFESPEIHRRGDFFALGGDSLMAAVLVAEIEQAFGVALATSVLVDNPTLMQLAACVHAEAAPPDRGMLVPVRRSGARRPFFIVHGLLGQVLFAHALARFLGEDQPLYALRARGLDEGETPHADLPSMAEDYLAAMRTVQPHGPYALGGYCSGAFVALEIARRLLERGEQVACVVGIDPLDPERSIVQQRLRRPGATPKDPAFRADIRQQLERFVYGRRRHKRDVLERAVEVGVALDVAFALHRPQPYPEPLTLIVSAERTALIRDPRQPWRRIAAGGMTLCTAAQRHADLFFKDGPTVGKMLQACLEGRRPDPAWPGVTVERYASSGTKPAIAGASPAA